MARLPTGFVRVLAAQGEGLASLCFRTSDIAKMHRRLDRLTLKPEPVAEVESRDVTSGATLSWKRTRAATDATRGVRLFFLELAKERPLSVRHRTCLDHRDGPCGGLDRRIPNAPRRCMARGSGSTWRSTVRIRIGAG